jgi:hypothetical protein
MSAYIKICLANLQGAPSSSVNPSESEAYMQKEKISVLAVLYIKA